jgi:putative transposase
MAESFVDSFKTELVADRPWRSRSELELAIVAWVGWYNHHRLHSSLGDVPPSEFEAPRDYAITGTVDLSSSFDLISSA